VDARPFRWIALIVILATIIISGLMSIVIPYNESQAKMNQYFGWKNTETGTEIGSSIGTSSLVSTPSVTPEPPLTSEAEPGRVTATATPKLNCTHPALYWVYHLDSWPEHFLLGNFTYTKDEALQFIQATPADASSLLFIHLNAAYLNMISGADATVIEEGFIKASEWMGIHPVGGMVSLSEAQQAIEMAQTLENYNEGNMGPGRCPDESSLSASQGAGISVPVLSVTPSAILLTHVVTPTGVSSATPTPTSISIKPTYIPPQATATSKPERRTNPKPTHQPPAPTEPPQPTREPQPTPPPARILRRNTE